MALASRILLLATLVMLLGHYLPAGYWLLAAQATRPPVIFFSPVNEEFLFIRPGAEGAERYGRDDELLSRETFERLLPLNYAAQLMMDGDMPTKLGGVEVTGEALREGRVGLRLRPAQIDAPRTRLYPLFEAESGRVQLELPRRFIRLGARVEILDAASNTVDAETSARFEQAFAAAGFRFPPRAV